MNEVEDRVARAEAGVPEQWHQMIAALVRCLDIDPQEDRFVPDRQGNLVIASDVKGATSSLYLWRGSISHDAERETSEVVEHLLSVRAFRVGDHAAPPERLMPRHLLMEEIVASAGVDAQDLLDQIWTARFESDVHPGNMGRFRWQTHREAPTILNPGNGRVRRPSGAREAAAWPIVPEGVPFLAGDLMADGLEWTIDTIVFDNRFILKTENSAMLLAIPGTLPETVMSAVAGRKLRECVSHPILDRHDIQVTSAKMRGSFTTLWLGGPTIRGGWPCRAKAEIPAELNLSPVRQAFEDLFLYQTQRIDRFTGRNLPK